MHDVTSNEALPVEIIVSWCDDLSMTSSKASFTKKEKIVEVESTKRQTTSEDRAFAVKQSSFCLEKGKERELSELSRPQKISWLPKLLLVSCEDLNSVDIISTGKQNMVKMQCHFQTRNSLFFSIFQYQNIFGFCLRKKVVA